MCIRDRDLWVRELPVHPGVIADEASFPWFRRGMEFEEFVPLFAEHFAEGDVYKRQCQTTWYGEAVPICARAAFQDSWHRVRGPAGYLGTLAGETSNPRHRRRSACRSCIEKVPGLPRLPYCYTDAYENSTRYGTDDLQETTSANLMNGHPYS